MRTRTRTRTRKTSIAFILHFAFCIVNCRAATYAPAVNLSGMLGGVPLVNGTISNLTLLGTLKYTNGAVNGFVLTTDAAGNASWMPASGGSGGQIVVAGTNVTAQTNGVYVTLNAAQTDTNNV